jgi:hypothetical protein
MEASQLTNRLAELSGLCAFVAGDSPGSYTSFALIVSAFTICASCGSPKADRHVREQLHLRPEVSIN